MTDTTQSSQAAREAAIDAGIATAKKLMDLKSGAKVTAEYLGMAVAQDAIRAFERDTEKRVRESVAGEDWDGPLTAEEQAMIDGAWERHKAAAPQKEPAMTDEQIKHMTERFLMWKLPANFNPDAGISFTAEYNIGTDYPMRHEPMGTNLFDYTQAEAMVRHMVAGMPPSLASEANVERVAELLEKAKKELSPNWADAASRNVIDIVSAEAIKSARRTINAALAALERTTDAG